MHKQTNELISQPANQLLVYSLDRSLNHSVRQPINQLMKQSISQSVSQSINQSINQSMSQSVSQSINQSINKSINQSINQLINQIFMKARMCVTCLCSPVAHVWVIAALSVGAQGPVLGSEVTGDCSRWENCL